MISDFVSGISKYFDSLRLIRSMGLTKYFIYSGLIGLVIILFLAGTIALSYDYLSGLLISIIPFDFGFLDYITDTLSAAVLGLVFFVIYKYLVLIFTAPVMSRLSEKVERNLRGYNMDEYTHPSVLSELWRGLRIALRNFIREIFYTILLMIGSIIPGLAVLGGPGIFLIQSYYAGFGNYDFWAERHFTFRGTIDFMGDHKGMVAANGLIFLLLLSIPIVGVFIAPPLATVASTWHATEKMYPDEVDIL
jgi:CysZ protein